MRAPAVFAAVLVPLLAVVATVPALAQAPSPGKGGVRFDPSYTLACLDEGGWTDCIGLAAQRCMEFTPGGYSTPVTNACLAAELDWWDGELNARYQELLARDRSDDANWQPIPGMVPRPSAVEALREMQRAWIGWRDTTCRYEELRWWGGTGASGAHTGCLMRLTGEQALALRSYQGEG